MTLGDRIGRWTSSLDLAHSLALFAAVFALLIAVLPLVSITTVESPSVAAVLLLIALSLFFRALRRFPHAAICGAAAIAAGLSLLVFHLLSSHDSGANSLCGHSSCANVVWAGLLAVLTGLLAVLPMRRQLRWLAGWMAAPVAALLFIAFVLSVTRYFTALGNEQAAYSPGLYSGVLYLACSLSVYLPQLRHLQNSPRFLAFNTLGLLTVGLLSLLYFNWQSQHGFRKLVHLQSVQSTTDISAEVMGRNLLGMLRVIRSRMAPGNVGVSTVTPHPDDMVEGMYAVAELAVIAPGGGGWEIVRETEGGAPTIATLLQDSDFDPYIEYRKYVPPERIFLMLRSVKLPKRQQVVLLFDVRRAFTLWLPESVLQRHDFSISGPVCDLRASPGWAGTQVASHLLEAWQFCLSMRLKPDAEAAVPRLIYSPIFMAVLLALVVLLLARYSMQQRRLHVALFNKRKELTQLLSSISEGVLRINEKRRIEYVNPALSDMLAVTGMGLVSRDFASMIAELDGSETGIKKRISDLMVQSENDPVFCSARLHNGADGTTPVDFSISPQFDRGEVVAYVCTLQDMSQRHEAARALTAHNQRLSKLMEELEMFSYMASHDLREPLRTIRSFVTLLLLRFEADKDAELLEELNFIGEAAQRMDVLVEDLLVLSRAGRSKLKPKSVDPELLVRDVMDLLQELITDTGAEIKLGPFPPAITVDSGLFSQVVQNLLDNAIKYRRPGIAPEISIWAERVGAFNQISVSDNGIGVAEEFRDSIFVPFRRLHGLDQYSGSGIGLATVSKIVERHGGALKVQASSSGGSVFTVVIPAELPAELPQLWPPAPVSQS